MGGDQFAVPGKGVRTASSAAANAVAPVGKSTQVDHEHPTRDIGGNAGIDAGGSAPPGPGMFLNDRQRTVLLVELDARIIVAEKNDTDALTELRAEFASKPPVDFGMLGDIVVTMLVGNAAQGVTAALKRLLNLDIATQYVKMTRATNVRVAGKIQTVSSKQLENVVRGAASPAQSALKAKLAPQDDEREQELTFVDWLRDTSTVTFQSLREDPIGRMTDAELLVYFASWEGSMHTPSHYKAIRSKQIHEFLASHAAEIGRHDTVDGKTIGGVTRETRVAWIRMDQSAPKLIYVSRDFSAMDVATTHARGAMPKAYDEAPMLGLNEGATFGAGGEHEHTNHFTPLNKVDGFLGYVEPAMQDIALQKHKATWQRDPEIFIYDYSRVPAQLIKE